MSGFVLASAIVSGFCYFKTKEILWLFGGALMVSLYPYTFLFIMPVKIELDHFKKTFKT
jgi:hypothetical protein